MSAWLPAVSCLVAQPRGIPNICDRCMTGSRSSHSSDGRRERGPGLGGAGPRQLATTTRMQTLRCDRRQLSRPDSKHTRRAAQQHPYNAQNNNTPVTGDSFRNQTASTPDEQLNNTPTTRRTTTLHKREAYAHLQQAFISVRRWNGAPSLSLSHSTRRH